MELPIHGNDNDPGIMSSVLPVYESVMAHIDNFLLPLYRDLEFPTNSEPRDNKLTESQRG